MQRWCSTEKEEEEEEGNRSADFGASQYVTLLLILKAKKKETRPYYTVAGYIGICPYVHSFVRTCPYGVTALQTSFLNRLS